MRKRSTLTSFFLGCIWFPPFVACLSGYFFVQIRRSRTTPRRPAMTTGHFHSDCNTSESNQSVMVQQNPTETVDALRHQAELLRAQVRDLQRSIQEQRYAKERKEIADIDRWIRDLLVNYMVNESTEILNDVDEVTRVLKDGRYSPEQVNKIFQRICATSAVHGRDRLPPMLELLIDATGKLDCMEREENPNKRWNGRVERDLRKKLFAIEYGIDLDEDES